MNEDITKSIKIHVDWLQQCDSPLERSNLVTHLLSDIEDLSNAENIDEYSDSLYYDEEMTKSNNSKSKKK